MPPAPPAPPDQPGVTPAPATPAPAHKRERSKGSAHVAVVQRTSPNITVRPGSIITYTIVTMNHGDGDTGNVSVVMPLNAAAVRLVDVAFSSSAAQVSAATDDSLTFETGTVSSNNDVVTTTVRLAVRSDAPVGSVLSGALTFSSRGGDVEGGGQSNTPSVVVGSSDTSADVDALNIEPPSGPAGTTHTFTSAIFAPGEPVTLWYNTPDGAVVGVTPIVSADAEGQVAVTFTTTGLTSGSYSMVARGGWTELTAVGAFNVAP